MAKLSKTALPWKWAENPIPRGEGRHTWMMDESEAMDALIARGATVDPDGDLTGAVIRWQVADGYAFYVVKSVKPLVLTWVPYGDRYQVDPALIRGLRLADVQQKVRSEQALRKLFDRKPEEGVRP